MNDCHTEQSVTDCRGRVTQAPRDHSEADGKVGDGATLAEFFAVDLLASGVVIHLRRSSRVVTGPDGPADAQEALGRVCVKRQRKDTTTTRDHKSVDKIAIYY